MPRDDDLSRSAVSHGGPLVGPTPAEILERAREGAELPDSYDGVRLDVPGEALVQTHNASQAHVTVPEVRTLTRWPVVLVMLDHELERDLVIRIEKADSHV